MILNIVTPTTRTENLAKIADSIISNKTPIQIRWWIIIDVTVLSRMYMSSTDIDIKVIHSPHTALAGHAHRNDVLDQISDPEEWFYSIDDDNVMHHDFLTTLYDAHMNGKSGLIVAQELRDRTLRLPVAPELVKLNHIDTAQFAFKVGLLDTHRFFEDRYDADGVFIEELYKQHSDKFQLVNKPLSYYNFLR